MTTGRSPGPDAVERLAAPFGIPAAEVLRRLHERDAIRLDPHGEAFGKAFEVAIGLGDAMRQALAGHGLTASQAKVIYVHARDGALV